MELTPHIEALHRDLGHAAALGDDDVRAAASRLLVALDPALRMTLVEVLSQAASHLSAELGDTAVEVRMAGREPQFVVTRSTPHAPEPPTPDNDDEGTDSSTTRLTLRIPDGLKSRADEAASQQGQSLNTWVVDAVRQALSVRSHPGRTHGQTGRRLTGWA